MDRELSEWPLNDQDAVDIETARRMYAKGYGANQLVLKFRRSRETVMKWVEGIERGPRVLRPVEQWERDAAVRLAGEGMPVAGIARDLNRAAPTVKYWIEQAENPQRTAGYDELRVEQKRKRQLVLDMVNEGKSYSQIRAALGVSENTIAKVKRAAGLL